MSDLMNSRYYDTIRLYPDVYPTDSEFDTISLYPTDREFDTISLYPTDSEFDTISLYPRADMLV